jgi:hypothetical protein
MKQISENFKEEDYDNLFNEYKKIYETLTIRLKGIDQERRNIVHLMKSLQNKKEDDGEAQKFWKYNQQFLNLSKTMIEPEIEKKKVSDDIFVLHNMYIKKFNKTHDIVNYLFYSIGEQISQSE